MMEEVLKHLLFHYSFMIRVQSCEELGFYLFIYFCYFEGPLY